MSGGGRVIACAVAVGLMGTGCAPKMYDYAPYRAHMPRSILVLPPLNESTDVDAPYIYLSTVSRPLAEIGYYVFPVAVVDALMKENGLPTPGEMHQVSLEKLGEVFGADAVLYVTVEEWGQKYQVIDSKTVVKARATLVDVATATQIWDGEMQAVQSSSAGQTDIISMLISAVITQVVASGTDYTPGVSRQATHQAVFDQHDGFLRGPHHPEYEADTRGAVAR